MSKCVKFGSFSTNSDNIRFGSLYVPFVFALAIDKSSVRSPVSWHKTGNSCSSGQTLNRMSICRNGSAVNWSKQKSIKIHPLKSRCLSWGKLRKDVSLVRTMPFSTSFCKFGSGNRFGGSSGHFSFGSGCRKMSTNFPSSRYLRFWPWATIVSQQLGVTPLQYHMERDVRLWLIRIFMPSSVMELFRNCTYFRGVFRVSRKICMKWSLMSWLQSCWNFKNLERYGKERNCCSIFYRCELYTNKFFP